MQFIQMPVYRPYRYRFFSFILNEFKTVFAPDLQSAEDAVNDSRFRLFSISRMTFKEFLH